jgi:hypothetical protein
MREDSSRNIGIPVWARLGMSMGRSAVRSTESRSRLRRGPISDHGGVVQLSPSQEHPLGPGWGLHTVELYAPVRRYVMVEGHSRREAARHFGISRDMVDKMVKNAQPPGYRRSAPIVRPR